MVSPLAIAIDIEQTGQARALLHFFTPVNHPLRPAQPSQLPKTTPTSSL
jgi:hypothetical protein